VSGLRGLAREARTVRRDQFELITAARCTLGVLIPLFIGVATGGVADGVAAAVGALGAGFGSLQGAYRTRLATTLVLTVGMAVSALVGSLAARSSPGTVVLVGAWGLLAGLMAALGQASLIVGLQWVVAVLVVAAIPMTPGQALVRSGMVLAGGLVQIVLVVVLWPLRSHAVERTALSGVYAQLAEFARALGTGSSLFPAGAGLNDAGRVLGDPQPFSRRGDLLAFQALFDEAERIRIQLVALGRHRSRVADAGGDTGPFTSLAAEAARVLDAVAESITRDNPPGSPPGVVEALEAACAAIEHGATGSAGTWVNTEAGATARAIAGQLRSALRIAAASAGRPDAAAFGDRPLPQRHTAAPAIREGAVTLRSNLSWQSASFRHAVRLSAVLVAATLVDRYSSLPRGYWIPLTALVILRPDFSSTAVRGLSRIAGTLAGAALATLLTALLRPGTVGLALLFSAASFFAFLTVRANYALFTISVTAYVVFLLAFVRLPALTAVSDRLVDTLIGGALAIIAYLAWPTWESRLVGPELARLLEAQSDYSRAVLDVFGDPSTDRQRQLADLRSAARLARSNAEASLARFSAEPAFSARSSPISLEQAAGVLAAARRYVLGVLSLNAQLPPSSAVGYPEVSHLSQALGRCIELNAAGLRTMVPRPGMLAAARSDDEHLGEPWSPHEPGRAAEVVGGSPAGLEPPAAPEGLPSLRAIHGVMTGQLRARLGELDNPAALLVAETDLMVDSANTLTELVEGQDPAQNGEWPARTPP
jgi:hypothetical protein